MAGQALAVRGLHKGFGDVRVLRGVDLAVEADELVALVGENGVGKTTLVRCVAGETSPDRGVVTLAGQRLRRGSGPASGRLDVVWQDLSLCDNLNVIDNLFLGREHGWHLPGHADRQVAARDVLEGLGVALPSLEQPTSLLSGGQRQAVALARTVLGRPDLLVLDEPTAALGSGGVALVETIIARMRAAGTAILLISHDLDLVCRVADRVLVLRDGVITAERHHPNLSADQLRAEISGLADDVLARRQLQGLRSLVAQLARVQPSDVLPLVVSAASVAMEQPRMALHLRREGPDGTHLVLAAALGLSPEQREAVEGLTVRAAGPQAHAVSSRTPVVDGDLRGHPDPATAMLPTVGLRSLWTVPLVGGDGVVGTLTGYSDAHGTVSQETLELAALYASHAAAALDREMLLDAVTRRNRTLETLRHVLETLTGGDADDIGLTVALNALRVGLSAAAVALLAPPGTGAPGAAEADAAQDGPTVLAIAGLDPGWVTSVPIPSRAGIARTDSDQGVVLSATVVEPAGPRTLAARWDDDEPPDEGAAELLVDGARSVLLALQRRATEIARQEAAALRRSAELQRAFLSRLSHELRTPLTAIHGYADTLRQPDISWDHIATMRFLDTIARESSRLGQLVTDLLDASAIEAAALQLHPDWCELLAVVERAVACLSPGSDASLIVDMPTHLPPIRADHDRLEQALVNIIGNALTHTPDGTAIHISAHQYAPTTVAVRVADDGPGLPDAVRGALFVAGVRGTSDRRGAGLGLTIAHGIVTAHGGDIGVDTSPGGTTFTITLPVEGPTGDAASWAIDVADQLGGLAGPMPEAGPVGQR